LSYVGDPFDYDVFVSYAHAEVETKTHGIVGVGHDARAEASVQPEHLPSIREWSKFVAWRLRYLLATALNVEGSAEVQVFLDDRVLVSGQPLTQTLREKVQRSALLVVLMSPLYPKKSWCLDELEWFFQQTAHDGRSQEHCTVLRIQPLAEDAWPKHLRDERGKAVVFRDFVDPRTELPICLTNLGAPQLQDALLEPYIELRGKLRSLRNQLEARRRLTVPTTQKPADRPVIYLDAAPDEEALWQSVKGELKDLAIVRPVKLAQANGDADLLDRARQKERRHQFALSNGLVLLYSGRDSWLEDAVATSYLDRRLLRQRQCNLPWAILDHVGSKPSVADDYDVPCVPATSGEWQRALLTALGLSSSNAGAAP
jgi:hypothetical protein